MDDLKIKPNYSELGRALHVDRHTIKKYHEHGCIPKRKKVTRKSKWDKYYDEIQDSMNIPGVTKTAVFHSLKYKYVLWNNLMWQKTHCIYIQCRLHYVLLNLLSSRTVIVHQVLFHIIHAV